jgi:hypothetical protein
MPDGEPAYEATLRDARKIKLYPSVTQVIGILAKPFVESWAVNLMSEVCYRNQVKLDSFYNKDESLDDYRARIEPIYDERRSEAAIIGSKIHDFAELALSNEYPSNVKDYHKQCELLNDWIHENIATATAEQSFAYEIGKQGYGGRIDAFGTLKDGRRYVIDFKTQKLKRGKPTYYDEWKYQLAAYREWVRTAHAVVSLGADGLAIDRSNPVCMSVVIDTVYIEPIHSREYTDDEMDTAFSTFGKILSAWYSIKGL